MMAIGQPPEQPTLDGSTPQRLTYDPTQSTGTTAWQMSLEHNRRLNAQNQD